MYTIMNIINILKFGNTYVCNLLHSKTPSKRNPILIHLNLCIALALGLVVFVSGIETATDNEACILMVLIHVVIFVCIALGCLQVCGSTVAVFIHICFLLDVM